MVQAGPPHLETRAEPLSATPTPIYGNPIYGSYTAEVLAAQRTEPVHSAEAVHVRVEQRSRTFTPARAPQRCATFRSQLRCVRWRGGQARGPRGDEAAP